MLYFPVVRSPRPPAGQRPYFFFFAQFQLFSHAHMWGFGRCDFYPIYRAWSWGSERAAWILSVWSLNGYAPDHDLMTGQLMSWPHELTSWPAPQPRARWHTYKNAGANWITSGAWEKLIRTAPDIRGRNQVDRNCPTLTQPVHSCGLVILIK